MTTTIIGHKHIAGAGDEKAPRMLLRGRHIDIPHTVLAPTLLRRGLKTSILVNEKFRMRETRRTQQSSGPGSLGASTPAASPTDAHAARSGPGERGRARPSCPAEAAARAFAVCAAWKAPALDRMRASISSDERTSALQCRRAATKTLTIIQAMHFHALIPAQIRGILRGLIILLNYY